MNPSVDVVVFPVAGLGTRCLPATRVLAKEMLPVVDKPLIQFATEEAVEAGARTLVFVTNRNKHLIEDHFDRAVELEQKLAQSGKHELLARSRNVLRGDVARVSVTQPDALGLGHAVLCAAPLVKDGSYFGVVLPDDLIANDGPGALRQMVELHQRTGASVVAVEEVPRDQTHRYGIVELAAETVAGERNSRISGIVEKPNPDVAPSNLAVVGRYVLSSRIMKLLLDTRPGAGGEIQLTDAIAALLHHEPVLAYRFDGKRYDCGNKTGYVEAIIDHALRHPETAEATARYLEQLTLERQPG